MAEANYDSFDAGGARSAGWAQLVNIAGAMAMVALIGGLGWWGYRLAVRDAHGVPVIKAMAGPMRTAPVDPGGQVARNAGLAVNQIASGGGVAEVPEQVVLAPPPVMLEPDDAPGIGAAAPMPAAVAAEEDSFARTLALAEELARQAAAEIAAEGETGAGTAPLPDHVVQSSPRPKPRPGAAGAAVADISNVTPVAARSVDLAAGELVPGTRLAQIGAFDDEAGARAEWDRVAARHPALFADKARAIQPAESLGRAFYRLQVAGFATEDESRQFCLAIEAGDLRCVPVTVR